MSPTVPPESPSPGKVFDDQAQATREASPQSAALLQKNVIGNDLPFESTEVLPAGTLLTVRLKSPLIAQDQGSNTTFEGIIDDPVVVDGNTLIPWGTVVSGRVGQVRISNLRPDRAYIRLTLESLNLDGLDLPLKTANLLARQKNRDIKSETIRLEKGRRLTFQLTEPFRPETEHLSARQ